MAALASIEERIGAIVGPEHLRPAQANDAVRGIVAGFVAEPGRDEEVAAILRRADEAGMAVVPRGGGTKLEWGNPPMRADLILSLTRLDTVVEHAWADMTVTVQAGCTIARLQDTLAQHGQRLAIDPLWPGMATVGGILATNDSGALRLRYGGLRDLIIGITVALADGTLASSGGRVVKNVAGYELHKLMTGALGTLGVITQATFRTHPLPYATRTCSFASSPEGLQACFDAIQDSTLTPAALQARWGSDAGPVVDVRFEGTEAGLAAQEAKVREIAGAPNASADAPSAWVARERLWDWRDGAIVRLSVVPAEVAATLVHLAELGRRHGATWQAVIQATGLGLLRLDGAIDALRDVLLGMRQRAEGGGGSLIVLQQPAGGEPPDAWGSAGDALPLMRAVKEQLDPQGTLNPGRFVGGI